MANPINGRLTEVHISVDSGTTYNAIGGLLSASLDVSTDEIETTDHDSTSKSFIPDLNDYTLNMEMNLEEGDTGQDDLFDNAVPTPTEVLVYMYPNNTTGKRYFAGTLFVTSLSSNGAQGSAHTMSVTGRISNLTVATVA